MEEKELSKGTKIKVAVITVLVILTTLAGISYAFFSIGVTGNEEASSVTVTAALLRLTYSDNLSLGGSSIYPGWSQSKTITVENTGTDTVYYKIIWRELLNQITNDELTISATCVANSGTCPTIEEQAISTYLSQTTNQTIIDKISIDPNVTHTYTVTVTFKEMSSAQNYNQGKSFYGTLNIAEGQAQTASFEVIGTDATTGFPVVRSISVPSEEFYVISDTSNNGINYSSLDSSFLNKINYDASKSILLAKNILYVGHTGSSDGSTISSSANGYGLQTTATGTLAYNVNESKSKVAKMSNGILTKVIEPGMGYYIGSVAFSGTNYWYDSTNSAIKTDYGIKWDINNIYDTTYSGAPNANFNNSDYSIAYYVENYVSSLGVDAEGRLLTYPEANTMTQNQRTNGQRYWLGSAVGNDGVRTVYSSGNISINGSYFNYASDFGVRPVIIVSTSDIQ